MEYQGPYECADCGTLINQPTVAVSLAATVKIRKPDGTEKPSYGSYIFCAPCAKKRKG